MRRRGRAAATVALAAPLLLAACAGSAPGRYNQPEAFGSTTTHSRTYAAPPAEACEAARRALLSQGFLILLADAQAVKGRKNFQQAGEVHLEIELNVVCAADGRGGKRSIAFVNALQDRYALKKSNNSASVGVGAFGSLSLPFSSSDDSLVRVASETITAEAFYDRYFTLLQRYLVTETEPPPIAAPVLAPVATPTAPIVAPIVAPAVPAASGAVEPPR